MLLLTVLPNISNPRTNHGIAVREQDEDDILKHISRA